MNSHHEPHDAAFSMNTAVTSALARLDTDGTGGARDADRDGAYHYARGMRFELLSNTPGIVERFAPYLVIGLVFSGLETRSVVYHPQEILAVTQVVCLEDSSTWSLRPLYNGLALGMSDEALTENLVLVCAGLLAGISDAIGTDPATLAQRHRTAFSDGLIPTIDWDALLGREQP